MGLGEGGEVGCVEVKVKKKSEVVGVEGKGGRKEASSNEI